jgi:hypothetical protein
MVTKSVTIKAGKPVDQYETVDGLLAAIDLADMTPAHIHELEDGRYAVCFGDCE